MKIKVTERMLSITAIALSILALLFLFGYLNSEVSYKYQVQDFQQAGKDASYGLDNEQVSILNGITYCKYAAIGCFVASILVLLINEKQPTFNDRLVYLKKSVK